MLEKNPELTNVQIKMKLKESARDMGLPKNQQGWGELDLERFYGTVISNLLFHKIIALVYKSIDERSVFGYHDS